MINLFSLTPKKFWSWLCSRARTAPPTPYTHCWKISDSQRRWCNTRTTPNDLETTTNHVENFFYIVLNYGTITLQASNNGKHTASGRAQLFFSSTWQASTSCHRLEMLLTVSGITNEQKLLGASKHAPSTRKQITEKFKIIYNPPITSISTVFSSPASHEL